MKESNRTFQEFEKRAWKPWILLHKKKIVVEQVILFRSQNVWDTTQVSLVFETIFFFPCFSCLSYQKTCILSSLHTQMTQYFNESDREMMKKEQEDNDMNWKRVQSPGCHAESRETTTARMQYKEATGMTVQLKETCQSKYSERIKEQISRNELSFIVHFICRLT